MDEPVVVTRLDGRRWRLADLRAEAAKTGIMPAYDRGGSTGAVLGPKTVPRRTQELIAKGLMTEEAVWKVHAENPARIYGVDVHL